jgi:two-component sensor histidine kinase
MPEQKTILPVEDEPLIRLAQSNMLKKEVEDDGVGMPEDFDMATSNGFGMELVNILSKQLDGTIHLEQAGWDEVYHRV